MNIAEEAKPAEQRIASLDDIVSEGNIVLVDGSVKKDSSEEEDLCWKMYDTSRFDELDYDLITYKSESLSRTIEILQYENVWTIEEITTELRRFLKILGEKLQFLSHSSKTRGRNPKSKEERRSDLRRQALTTLNQQAYALCRLARSKELRWNREIQIDAQKYSCLLEMIKTIDRAIGLKKDTRYVYGRHDRDMSLDSDTDDRLVASLFYLSIFSDKRPAIITNDTDFVRLIGVAPRLMGAKDFIPDNYQFREAIKSNPVRVYIPKIEGYQLAVETLDLDFQESFRIEKRTFQESERVRQKVMEEWERFSEFLLV